MPRGRKGERALGPYPQGRKFRIWIVGADGERLHEDFAREAEAIKRRNELNQAASNRTIDIAVARYLEHMAKFGAGTRGVPMKPSSITTARFRLRGLLLGKGDGLLATLTEKRANELYQVRVKATKPDTHRAELFLAHTFGAWCVDQGWLGSNPFDKVRPEGRLSTGKPGLTFDEAKRFLSAALAGDNAHGVAAAMALMMGLRVSEIVNRVVRDLDNGGTALRITEAKTRAGNRVLSIPALLQPRLVALAAGKAPTDRLFAFQKQALRMYVIRLCNELELTRVTPHGLRGTAATQVLSLGGDIDSLARYWGHNDRGATLQRHYLKPGTTQEVAIARAETLLTEDPTTAPTTVSTSGNETRGIITDGADHHGELN